jgi:hypothetical protein
MDLKSKTLPLTLLNHPLTGKGGLFAVKGFMGQTLPYILTFAATTVIKAAEALCSKDLAAF